MSEPYALPSFWIYQEGSTIHIDRLVKQFRISRLGTLQIPISIFLPEPTWSTSSSIARGVYVMCCRHDESISKFLQVGVIVWRIHLGNRCGADSGQMWGALPTTDGWFDIWHGLHPACSLTSERLQSIAGQDEGNDEFENPSNFSGLGQNSTIQEFPKLSTSLSGVEYITAPSSITFPALGKTLGVTTDHIGSHPKICGSVSMRQCPILGSGDSRCEGLALREYTCNKTKSQDIDIVALLVVAVIYSFTYTAWCSFVYWHVNNYRSQPRLDFDRQKWQKAQTWHWATQ